MDKYVIIQEELKKINETHPNITNLWINYLKKKKENYDKSIEQSQNFIKFIKRNSNAKDIPKEAIRNLNNIFFILNNFN